MCSLKNLGRSLINMDIQCYCMDMRLSRCHKGLFWLQSVLIFDVVWQNHSLCLHKLKFVSLKIVSRSWLDILLSQFNVMHACCRIETSHFLPVQCSIKDVGLWPSSCYNASWLSHTTTYQVWMPHAGHLRIKKTTFT